MGRVSTFFPNQTNADLTGLVFGKPNAGTFQRSLNLQHGIEIAFHNTLSLFNPLQSGEADSGYTSQGRLAPS